MLRKLLLVSGIISSALYVAIDQIAALRFPAYHSFAAQTISELMARGAPTKATLDPLFYLYGLLMAAFAIGVWMSARGSRPLRITAVLLLAYALLGLPGPALFPMYVRGSAPAGGDLPHIVFTSVLVVFILAAVACGAFALGRRFRVYSLATIVTMIVFGALVGIQARAMSSGDPTPWIGLAERVDIGAFLLWVAVLALALVRRPAAAAAGSAARPIPLTA